MWKEYERKLYEFLSDAYPDCEITFDDFIFGIFSNVERQIDFAIRGNLAGKRILGIVDCKYYKKNIDVKIIESFIGMMQDINANFGFMITNQGYSQAAKNRVKNSNLKLDVLNFNELNEIEVSVDYFFNQNIKGLQLSKSEFFKRNKQNTSYFDEHKSDYKKRIIYFKEGFANSEYFAFKKLLENSVRVFRDFEQLNSIKLIIPVIKCDFTTNYIEKESLYFCDVSKYEIEKFLKTNISYLRDDIINWRKDFLEAISKTVVQDFGNKYVKQLNSL